MSRNVFIPLTENKAFIHFCTGSSTNIFRVDKTAHKWSSFQYSPLGSSDVYKIISGKCFINKSKNEKVLFEYKFGFKVRRNNRNFKD